MPQPPARSAAPRHFNNSPSSTPSFNPTLSNAPTPTSSSTEDMFKPRAHGSKNSAAGFAAPLFGQSPSSAPLLASAQTPGMSNSANRLSETSLASYDQPMTRASSPMGSSSLNPGGSGPLPRHGAPGSFTSFTSATNPRYGPTASLSPQSSAGSRLATPVVGGLAASTASETVPLRAAAAGGGAGGGGAYASGMDDEDLDDQLHTFTAADHKNLASPFTLATWRGWANGLTLFILLAGFVVLFAGYPIIDWYYTDEASSGSSTSGYNLGGINSSGQYPSISGFPTLIDADTPTDVYTRTGYDGNTWNLVFSDEFNKDGRTFYDGDDPFFTGVDLNYWPTGDFEWYDPGAITTKDGHLVITITQEPIHNLNFKSGMLQSWNQLCFNKNGYIEVSVSLPGTSAIGGFWPGVWTMGNLGRPGYGASTDGMWPYTYDSCDIGILPNQTWLNGTGPDAALTTGGSGGPLSYLPGQRASACTCPGLPHPGPSNSVGRGAVEIDIIEAQIVITEAEGQVSQSAQVAPFDAYYQFNNASEYVTLYDTDITAWNSYLGGDYQQAVSALTMVADDIYYSGSGDFAAFGMEWSSDSSDRSNGYITWVSQGKQSWKMDAGAVGASTETQIGQRLVAEEPMALVFNLGMSNNFQNVDFSHLTFPNYLRIDYIRVWQLDTGTVGCDPSDHPTADYIALYPDVYANPNLTTWAGAGYTMPNNTLQGC